jgi:hypothetical protein
VPPQEKDKKEISSAESADEHSAIDIQPLRTYKSDVEDIFKRGQLSAARVVFAEKKRKEQNPTPVETLPAGKSRLSRPAIIVSFFLIIIGVSLIFYALKLKQPEEVDLPVVYPSLISVESKKGLNAAGLDRARLIAAVSTLKKSSPLPLGAVTQLILIKNTTPAPTEANPTPKPFKEAITVAEFLNLLQTKAPPFLVRALRDEFVLGVHGYAGNQPFLIFKIQSFENAYAGMIAWEETLLDDLGPLITREVTNWPLTDNDSTATSTNPADAKAVVIPGQDFSFRDLIVRNLDTRVKMDKGEIVFLWSFPDRETLVITNNDRTFRDIVARLQAAKIVR